MNIVITRQDIVFFPPTLFQPFSLFDISVPLQRVFNKREERIERHRERNRCIDEYVQ